MGLPASQDPGQLGAAQQLIEVLIGALPPEDAHTEDESQQVHLLVVRLFQVLPETMKNSIIILAIGNIFFKLRSRGFFENFLL